VIWLDGSDQQRLWIVPALRLTVLRIGDEPAHGWDEAMIPDTIMRGTSAGIRRCPARTSTRRRFAPH
jgi:hypothetical protein